MSPTLVPCLAVLRAEFNQVAAGRDKSSDGWIGDPAHAARQSDHNPDSRGLVHAIDVDDSGAWPAGFSMAKAVQTIVTRQRTGADDRLQNIIYERKIWSRSWGWTARTYNGSNPHDKHAHFSARYTSAAENDTRPWGLLPAPAKPAPEEFVVASEAEVRQIIREEISKQVGPAVIAALEQARPYQASGPRKRLQDDRTAAGLQPWGDLSARQLLEYLFDGSVNGLGPLLQQVLAEVSDDPQVPVTLDAGQVAALAEQVAARMPTAAQVAEAVNDEHAARMQA